MNVLITGVAGLVGANFAEYLLSKRQELGIDKVIGVDDLSGGYVENLDLKNVNFELCYFCLFELQLANCKHSFHLLSKV